METSIQALTRLKQGPRPVIGCLPLYPPLEIFHSLGLAPVVLWGLQDSIARVPEADRHIQNFVCAVGRRLAQLIMVDGRDLLDGLFFYNACDTLRNLPEILREGRALSGGGPLPLFRLHLPMTSPEQADASQYLAAEINNLIQSLEKHYGVSFSGERFSESVALYDRARDLYGKLEQAVAEGRISLTDFCRTLKTSEFMLVEDQIALFEDRIEALDPAAAGDAPSARLIISGILPPPPTICEMIDQLGLRMAGNDIASLHRSRARLLNFRPDSPRDPAAYYVEFYKNHFPCTTLLYTADRRIEAVLNLVSERSAEGFVFIGEKFCEYEYFEWPWLEKKLKDMGIAVLSLETAMDDSQNLEAFRTRLEAFTEIVAGRGGRK